MDARKLKVCLPNSMDKMDEMIALRDDWVNKIEKEHDSFIQRIIEQAAPIKANMRKGLHLYIVLITKVKPMEDFEGFTCDFLYDYIIACNDDEACFRARVKASGKPYNLMKL